MPDNLLACRTASYGKYSESAFEHLPTIGVNHVEIPTPAPDQIEQVKARLAKHGLSASSLQATIEIESDEVADLLVPTLEAATALNAKILFVSVKAGEMDKQIVYEHLRRAGEKAAEYGITIGMETHPDLITNADVAIETMKGVDHPNVRVNYDTANIHYYNQNVDHVEEMKKVINYIGSMHLKDTDGRYKTWCFPTFGEGIVDFKTVFDLLNDRGYNGPFTMEIEGVEGENLDEAQTCQRVADSVAYLRRIGCGV
jgi:inosose dehydratase